MISLSRKTATALTLNKIRPKKVFEQVENFEEKLFNENPSEALKYYKQMADKGDIDAMYKYANMMQNGFGCKADKIEATKYSKMSADRWKLNSMYNYGLLLHSRDGIKIDKKENISLLQNRCKKSRHWSNVQLCSHVEYWRWNSNEQKKKKHSTTKNVLI